MLKQVNLGKAITYGCAAIADFTIEACDNIFEKYGEIMGSVREFCRQVLDKTLSDDKKPTPPLNSEKPDFQTITELVDCCCATAVGYVWEAPKKILNLLARRFGRQAVAKILSNDEKPTPQNQDGRKKN